jgi:hypothetical protein
MAKKKTKPSENPKKFEKKRTKSIQKNAKEEDLAWIEHATYRFAICRYYH